MRRGAVLLVVLFMGMGSAFAQNLAKVYGRVADTTGVPIDGASVKVMEVPTLGVSTTEAGRYELSVPVDREITIVVSKMGCISQQRKITVGAGKQVQLNFKLIDTAMNIPGVIVRGYPTFEDGMNKIDPKIISVRPGPKSGGVESSVISSSLGVKQPSDLSYQYNVRGGNYDENLIYLNDMEIYRPFLIRSGQQEGLSFINPDLVSAVSFSSGGFDAVYGDKMSSVLDVQYKKPTEFGASLAASLLGATGHIQGITPNKKTSALFGVRYQANGYIFSRMSTKGTYRPTFTDVQLLLNHKPKPNSKWEFNLFGNYARNVYKFMPDSITEVFGLIDDSKKFKGFFEGQEIDAFQSIFASFTTKYSADSNTDLKLNFSYFNTQEKETFDIYGQYFLSDVNSAFGDSTQGEEIFTRDVGGDMHHGRNFLNAHIFHGELRGEHRIKKSRLEWGVKGQGEFVDDKLSEWRLMDSADYSLPNIPTVPSDSIGVPFEHPSRLITMRSSYLKVNNSLHTFRTNGFIQNRWKFGNDTTHQFILTAGARLSYWNFNDEWFISPRTRLIYIPKRKPQLSFYLATGLYFQPAFYKEMRLEDGSLNDNIKPQKSYHVIVGSNYFFEMFRRQFKLSSEVYYKYLWDLTTYNVDNVRILYSGKNDAKGYAVGIDAKLSGEFVKNLESWVNFSLMQTMERIKGIDTFSFRPTDQRFAVHVFFQDKIRNAPMFKVHVSMFYSTGLPYCPPNLRSYGNHGKALFRTDIGFSWQFIDAATRLSKKKVSEQKLKAGYLTFEVSNLFNYSNVIAYSWVAILDDYGNNIYCRVPHRLTPRLFNVKLRVEF